MAQDNLNSIINVPKLTEEQQATLKLLTELKSQFIDTASGVIKLNEALFGANTNKSFAATSKAVSDGLDKINETQKKVVDTEAKAAQQREKQMNAYLVGLSKQQAAEDAAAAKRLAQIDKETAALQAAQAKRAQVLAQDPNTYRGSDTILSDSQVADSTAKTEALANERVALIASAEAEQVLTAAKVEAATVGVEENAELITTAENLIRLKAELAQVSAALKETGSSDAALTVEQIRLTTAIKETSAILNAQVKQDIAAEGSFVKQEARLKELTLAYYSLSEAERTSTAAGLAMKAEIDQLDPIVKKNSASIGQFGKEVGGYETAIGKVLGRFDSLDKIGARVLQNVLRSVTRLAVEFTIFAVASAAFTYLVAYLQTLDLFKDKLSAAVEILKDFNEVNKNVATDLGKSQTIFKVLSDTAANTALSLKERTAAGAELIKQFPKELAGSTALGIANGEEKGQLDALSKSLIENAKARAALTKIQELQGKINDDEFEKEKIGNKNFNEVARGVQEYEKALRALAATRTAAQNKSFGTDEAGIQRQIQNEVRNPSNARAKQAKDLKDQDEKIIQQQIDFLVKYAGGEDKIAKVIETEDKTKDKKPKAEKDNDTEALRRQAEALKAVADNEKNAFETRYAAAELYYKKLQQISDKDEENAKNNGATKKQIADLETANIEHDINAYNAEVAKIDKDRIDRQYEQQKEAFKNLQDLTDAYSEKQLAELADNYAAVSLALSDKYAKGLLNEKEYQEAKFQLTKSYNKLVRDEQIRALEERINNDKAAGADTTEDQAKLDKLLVTSNKEANETQTHNNKEAGKKYGDGKKEVEKLAKQAAQEVISAIQTVGDAQFDDAKKQIDTQKAAIDTQTQNQVDAENRSLDSSKVKQDKINLINAKALDKKADLDKKARKIDHDKAVFDREISIAKIAISTAEAIANAYADYSFPFNIIIAGIMGALGAVEIATVLATPLPAYAKGGKTKGGKFVAGELGTELMIDPSGRLGLTPDKATVMSAPAGTTIVDSINTMKILANPERAHSVNGMVIDLSKLEASNNEIVRELKNKPQQQRSNHNYTDWSKVYRNYIN